MTNADPGIEEWPDDVRLLIAAADREAAGLAGMLPGPVPQRVSVPGYELVSELGRGGMGVVYKAYQLSTKRAVALKVLLAGEFAAPAARTRFQREVELTARLQHQGIVRVLESGLTSGGQQYYAMDYVDAAPLDRWLLVSRSDVRTMLATFMEICEALDHAHQHGVIHRDLKPGNVLIDSENKAHVLDFGLAKSSDHIELTATTAASVSMPGQIVGTLRYLSPEQAAGRPEEIDARTDVYALGVMLFEALTGSPPYDTTGHPSAVIQRIIETPPTRPSSLSDRVDGELETIILKAMEKERVRRYQTARELGEDLGRYLRGEPILARPPSTVYRLRKRLWRNRLLVAMTAAAVVLAAVGVGGSRWWTNRLHAREDQHLRMIDAADLLLKRGQYDEARECYDQILAAFPESRAEQTYWHRALADLCQNKYEEATRDYDESVRIGGAASAWCYYRRATSLWITNQLDQAAADYREVLERITFPTFATARLFLLLHDQARLFDTQGRESEAHSARAEADRRLDDFLARVDIRGKWLEEICTCLTGKLDPQELTDRAEKRPSAKGRCEAYYYAGEVYRLKASETADADQAREWMSKAVSCFGKSVATGLTFDLESGQLDPMNEYHLAKWRLDGLTAGAAAAASQAAGG